MTALHLQALDIIPQIPEAMMGDVLDYLSYVKKMAEEQDAPAEELDLSGLPRSVNADKMTDEELISTLREGIDEVLAGKRGIPCDEFRKAFEARHHS